LEAQGDAVEALSICVLLLLRSRADAICVRRVSSSGVQHLHFRFGR